MRRPLAVTSGAILLFAKSVSLFYLAFGAASAVHLRQLGQPLAFFSAALSQYLHSKTARRAVGAFFVLVTLKEAIVFPTFAGPTLDLIRRPFSMAIGAWLAWALLFSRDADKGHSTMILTRAPEGCS